MPGGRGDVRHRHGDGEPTLGWGGYIGYSGIDTSHLHIDGLEPTHDSRVELINHLILITMLSQILIII